MRFCPYIRGNVVTWHYKKKVASYSIVEVEYQDTTTGTHEMLWLQYFLLDLVS